MLSGKLSNSCDKHGHSALREQSQTIAPVDAVWELDEDDWYYRREFGEAIVEVEEELYPHGMYMRP